MTEESKNKLKDIFKNIYYDTDKLYDEFYLDNKNIYLTDGFFQYIQSELSSIDTRECTYMIIIDKYDMSNMRLYIDESCDDSIVELVITKIESFRSKIRDYFECWHGMNK